jgi:putative transposase
VTSELQFLNVCRYVEANPIRAGLVDRADQWPYSSASSDNGVVRPELAQWPIPKPQGWSEIVNGL